MLKLFSYEKRLKTGAGSTLTTVTNFFKQVEVADTVFVLCCVQENFIYLQTMRWVSVFQVFKHPCQAENLLVK